MTLRVDRDHRARVQGHGTDPRRASWMASTGSRERISPCGLGLHLARAGEDRVERLCRRRPQQPTGRSSPAAACRCPKTSGPGTIPVTCPSLSMRPQSAGLNEAGFRALLPILPVRQGSSDGFVVATLVADAARKRLKSLLLSGSCLIPLGRINAKVAADVKQGQRVQQTVIVAPLAGWDRCIPERLHKLGRFVGRGSQRGDRVHRNQAS